MEAAKKIETLRVNIWKLGEKIDEIKSQIELMKYQIIELESIENKNSNNGVEAVIDPQRILTRRGSKAKTLALAQAINRK
jgi:phage shock protein A